MQDSRSYHAYPSNLNVMDSFSKLDGYLSKCGFKEDRDSSCPNAKFSLELSSTRTLNAHDFPEFIELLKQFPHSMPISLHAHFVDSKKQTVACIVQVRKAEITITIDSRDLNILSAFHDRLKEYFQLSNPLENDQKPASRYDLKRTVFLAHRFDKGGIDTAGRVREFLSRLGFQVLEGTGYEARDIPDKVMDKIRTQDIFICLVTEGDPSWILSEAATAHAIAKYMIILCQAGVAFNRGIIGQDYEYLEFPEDNIEKAYSPLLYALPSLA